VCQQEYPAAQYLIHPQRLTLIRNGRYRSRAELSIQYTLNISLRNGIVPRLAMAGINDTENCVDESDAPADSRCREKVPFHCGEDQIILLCSCSLLLSLPDIVR
jgi:hypothetical protein